MLRLEITAGPYNRALEVLKTWERRASDNTFIYTVPYLNNAVYPDQLVKQPQWDQGAHVEGESRVPRPSSCLRGSPASKSGHDRSRLSFLCEFFLSRMRQHPVRSSNTVNRK
jgi:hypothetical protein